MENYREKQKKKSKHDVEDVNPPYKVSFPGEESCKFDKDPRLGRALRSKISFYRQSRFFHDDDGDESWRVESDESDDERDENTIVTHVSVVNLPPLSDAEYEEMSKRHARNIRRSYELAIVNEPKMLKKRDCECAEEAIRFYNKENGTDYEIVETLGSFCRLSIGFWYHCNFRAQRKCSRDSPKLFFAELNRKTRDGLVVKLCIILDNPGNYPGNVRSCKVCKDHLWHPVKGLQVI